MFVHGVGGPSHGWERQLPACVADAVTVRYDDLFHGSVEPEADSRPRRPHSPLVPQPGWRTPFGARREQLADLVADAAAAPGGTDGAGRMHAPVIIPGALLVKVPLAGMPHAARYRHHRATQRAVHERVISAIGHRTRPVVLVAHSLGSVVAVDVLHEHDVRVDLLLTLGSPIGVDTDWCADWERLECFPRDRIGGWANVINTRDLIPWNRPVARRFPEAVDAFISAGRWPFGPGGAHDPATYLRAPVTRQLIAWAGRAGSGR